MLHNINPLYLHRIFHGIRFKVNNEDWLSVRIAFFMPVTRLPTRHKLSKKNCFSLLQNSATYVFPIKQEKKTDKIGC